MLTRKTLFKILVLTFVYYLSLSQDLEPTSFKKIEIYGNKNLPTREIISAISDVVKSNAKTDEKIENIKQSILNLYIYNSFFFASIDSIKPDKDKLKIFINEGERVRIGKIKIKGNEILSNEQIREMLGFKEGDFFSSQILKERINKILDKYANLGHPLAEIEIENFNFEERQLVNFTLKINEGRPIKIDQIKIQGNNVTKEDLILRETKIKKGEIYREDKIKQVRRRLTKLGLFETVYEPEIFFNDTTSGILIKVKEGRMNSFDGIIGYIPQAGSSRGYLTGYINILLKNLFGSGRKFGARWNAETQETQEFELSYFEPYVFNFPINAEISFYQRKQDSTYVIRRPQINFEFELTRAEKASEIFKASFYISQTSIIPTATEFVPQQIYESRTLNFGLGLLYDSRDDLNFPSSGIYFSSSYELGNKKILGPEKLLTPETKANSTVNKFKLALDFYFNFEKILKSVFVPKFNAVIITGSGLDESDAFRFGGTKTLRGYREKEFLATRAIWSNFENRFKISDDLVLFNFIDVGYIYHPMLFPRIMNSFEAIRYGYGLGVRFETKIGKLNLIYALGKDDSFKTGKIHIGIESEF